MSTSPDASMPLTTYSDSSSLTQKDKHALSRLEMAFVKSLNTQKSIQKKYRIISYIIVFLNIVSICYLYKYFSNEATMKPYLENVYLKDLILPLSAILFMLIFFSNASFRSNLMSVRIYLRRLNTSLHDFNLYFCGRFAFIHLGGRYSFL